MGKLGGVRSKNTSSTSIKINTKGLDP
jgi:hypothetical protein